MTRSWSSLVILLAWLLLSACQRPALPETEVPDDGPAIPVSEVAAMAFLTKSAAAARSATESGSSTLTIHQEEITSALALSAELPQRMATMQAEAMEEARSEEVPPLPNLDLMVSVKEPQVYFRGDGTIVMRGRIEFRNRFQPFRFVTRPRAEAGTLELDFVEGLIGRVPMPEAIFDRVGGLLVRAILLGQRYAEITVLSVEEGTMTIGGRRNQ